MKISNTIFVSYKRTDLDKAQRLRQALRAEGLNVWWDEELRSGEHWAVSINSVLKKVYAVVVLWSSESVKSDWVRYEAAIGSYRNLLTHALIDNVELPEPFRSIHVADLSNWEGNEDDKHFLRLVNSINKFRCKALIKKISKYCFISLLAVILLITCYIHINPIEKKKEYTVATSYEAYAPIKSIINDCNIINPIFKTPIENENVLSPLELTGTVSEIPKNCFFWAVVYNPKTKTFGDFEPIQINSDKSWKRNVNLIGGKVGDEYIIYLFVANKEGDNELSKLTSQAAQSLPENGKNMTKCNQISVKLRH